MANPNHAANTDFFLKAVREVLNQSVKLSPEITGRLAFRVLSAPRRKPLLEEEAAFLLSSHKDRLVVGTNRIRTYHWAGSGPRILLAHGWDSSTARWLPLAQRLLALNYDLFALDAPGHGGTKGSIFTVVDYSHAIAAFAEACQPQIIIGHSAGGMATVYYLTHSPDAHQPDGLVLLATPGELTDFIETFQEALQLKEQVIESLEGYFIRTFNRPFGYFSVADFAESLSLPGLIIHDTEDEVAPFDNARRVHHNWPNSELMMTTGLGHSLQDEQVFARILQFVDRLVGSRERSEA